MTQTDIYYSTMGVQEGLEVTPGTLVAASRRMATLSIDPTPEATTTLYTSQGLLVPVGSVLGEESMSWAGKGPLDYNEICYLLNIFLASVTPTVAGSLATWVWTADATTETPTDSWSLEWGNQGTALGFQATYAKLTDFTLKSSKKSVEVDVKGIARKYAAGTTMTTTGSITPIAKMSVSPRQLNVYIATTMAGLTSATALTRNYTLDFALTGRYVANMPVNRATPDFDNLVPGVLKPTASITVGAAGAVPVDLRQALVDGTQRFFRLEAVGPLISGTDYYTIQFDFPAQVTKPGKWADSTGVAAQVFDLVPALDNTSNTYLKVTVKNKLITAIWP